MQNVPLQNVPLQNVPLQNVPLQNVPLQNVPLQNVPLQNVPLQNVPLQNVPLQNVPLVAYSGQPGTSDEEVSDVALYAKDFYYVMVAGHNGAFSSEPYTLTVEVQPPPPLPVCSRSLPFQGTPGQLYEPFGSDGAQTLILFPKQRLESLYGPAAVAPLVANLHLLADHPTVKGSIVPLEQDDLITQAFDAWDASLVCDPEAANTVTWRIKGFIASLLASHPNVHNILLIGNDEALPFRRIKDIVATSNEQEYVNQALVKTDTALYASLSRGYLLTDDFYADLAPSLYQGRALYVPDYAIGRLVESPDEINGMVDEYLQRDGVLDAATGLVYAYDFLKDSAALIAASFAADGLMSTVVNNDTWGATQLRSDLLGARHDLNSLNAHFNHFLLEPADRNQLGTGGLFTATELISSTVNLAGTVNFSVGCHSGLNVCDVCTSDFGKLYGAQFDFAQAFAIKRAAWIANTGYGYGDDTAATLSEELMSRFAANVGSAPSIGDAFRQAKQDYALLSMGAYGPYDEKALDVSTLYGIPTYRVQTPANQPGQALSAPASAAPSSLRTSLGPLQPTAQQGLTVATYDVTPTFTRVDTDLGSYFQTSDGYQALLYNPLQPRLALDVGLPDDPDSLAHGALFVGGDYTDFANFDPVITMPVTETKRYEPQFIYSGWQPPDMVRLNHFQTPSGIAQRLVLTLGQFLHGNVVTDANGTHVTGTERRYDHATYDVYYTTSDDFLEPTIAYVNAISTPDAFGSAQDRPNAGQQMAFTVRASDASGLARVVVTYTDRTGTWQSFDLTYDPNTQAWQGVLTGLQTQIVFLVQAVDNAGNVALSAAKGALYGVTNVALSASPTQAAEGAPITLTADPGPSLGQPQDITWDLGDGQAASDVLTLTHRYADNGSFDVTFRLQDVAGQVGTGLLHLDIANVPPDLAPLSAVETTLGQALTLAPIPFSDPGLLDTHTASIDWGDGSPAQAGVITPLAPPTPAAGVQAQVTFPAHAFPAPGPYTAAVCVRDKDGAQTCQDLAITVNAPTYWFPLYLTPLKGRTRMIAYIIIY